MWFSWLNSLRAQIILLLTLALFPLGAVAIYQTSEVEKQSRGNAELALLAVTGRAAKDEELVIQRGFGIAALLASLAGDYVNDPDNCQRSLSEFLSNKDEYSFIGILPLSGVITCSSSGETADLSNYSGTQAMMTSRSRQIGISRNAVFGSESVFVLSVPFYTEGDFAGVVTLSVPHRNLPDRKPELAQLGLIDLIAFNFEGEVLSARSDLDAVMAELPADVALTDLATETNTAFQGLNQAGEPRQYTVVPIEDASAVVIGVWMVGQGLGQRIDNFLRPGLFPALMWLASMAVAMLSIHMLVIRHINRMRKDMDKFADTRLSPQDNPAVVMPTEVAELSENFKRMTVEILQDEAKFEGILREKNILIKEVHHRVKNNLQLISSIMNMQIRAAQHDETKTALSRLQDRVLSLATIHRDLYESKHDGKIDMQRLLVEVFEQTVKPGTRTDCAFTATNDIDPILLFPDQAVPLSLAVSEALTNASSHIGIPPDANPFLSLSVKQADDLCTMTVSNSIGAGGPVERQGLGTHLINAFVIQLGGQIDIQQTAQSYSMIITFHISEFDLEVRDF